MGSSKDQWDKTTSYFFTSLIFMILWGKNNCQPYSIFTLQTFWHVKLHHFLDGIPPPQSLHGLPVGWWFQPPIYGNLPQIGDGKYKIFPRFLVSGPAENRSKPCSKRLWVRAQTQKPVRDGKLVQHEAVSSHCASTMPC